MNEFEIESNEITKTEEHQVEPHIISAQNIYSQAQSEMLNLPPSKAPATDKDKNFVDAYQDWVQARAGTQTTTKTEISSE